MHIHSVHNHQGRQEAKISWKSENAPEMLAGNRGLMQAALPGQDRGGKKQGNLKIQRKPPLRVVSQRRLSGADTRIRTGDLILTKDALYLLSYISVRE